MIWILAILDLIFIANDAIRDKGVNRVAGWWVWHITKWISFFGPQILIIVLLIDLGYIPLESISAFYGVLYLILASIVWNVFYRRCQNG